MQSLPHKSATLKVDFLVYGLLRSRAQKKKKNESEEVKPFGVISFGEAADCYFLTNVLAENF